MKYILVCTGSVLLAMGCSKSGSGTGAGVPPVPPVVTKPAITITGVTQARANSGTSNYRFTLTLDKASDNVISVNYTTTAGTAVADTDFTPETGTLTIPAKTTNTYIDIPVKGDSLRQADQTFFVQISNPVNATINGTGIATGDIQNLGTYLPIQDSGYIAPTSYPGYTLAWSDEFTGKTLDPKVWNAETGGGGWGNNELEYYTSSTNNAYLTGGYLVIEARQEQVGTNNYTSARINTMGNKEFTYGRVDIRAKLPVATGMWPALWMLGSNFPSVGWPTCGEMDIMELVGSYPSQITGSLHWPIGNPPAAGTLNANYDLSNSNFSQAFHVFSMIWKQDSVQYLVDGQVYFSKSNADVTSGTYVFNNPMFFIFNVAVGGNWPGSPNSSTLFPQRMIVDYVRVYQ